jgi:hypothetical protein
LKKIILKLIPFFLFTLLLAAIPLGLKFVGMQKLVAAQFWVMFAFVSFLTLVVLIFVLLIQQLMPEYYAQAFIAATVFKMLACLSFMLFLVLKTTVDKPAFVADFFYLYFLNTGFEVYVLLRNLRNQKLK